MHKAKTLEEVIRAIQDSSSDDSEAITRIHALLRSRRLKAVAAESVPALAGPQLRLAHSCSEDAPALLAPAARRQPVRLFTAA